MLDRKWGIVNAGNFSQHKYQAHRDYADVARNLLLSKKKLMTMVKGISPESKEARTDAKEEKPVQKKRAAKEKTKTYKEDTDDDVDQQIKDNQPNADLDKSVGTFKVSDMLLG